MYYYSLKTKTEEHVLEPRTDGDYSYGVFDKSAELVKKKEVISKHDIFEFIYKKQASLKGKFVKVEMETVKEVKKEQAPEKGERVMRKEKQITDNAIIETETRSVTIPSEEYNKTKDLFSIKSEINLKTKKVVFYVECSPSKDYKETQETSFLVMSELVPKIIDSLPNIIDHIILAGASAKTEASLERVSSVYNGMEVKSTVREILKDVITKSLNSQTYGTN